MERTECWAIMWCSLGQAKLDKGVATNRTYYYFICHPTNFERKKLQGRVGVCKTTAVVGIVLALLDG